MPQFEDQPLTRAEYIGVLTHFYRAEMQRSTVWRMRLDTTTNWSIISVMGLISFAMRDHERSQPAIVMGMLLVFTFLVIEARRFRFFDVWRSRVRMLEKNFIGPVLLRNQIIPIRNWGKMVADDLVQPRYKLTWHQAVRVRLVRNYLPMFALMLVFWSAGHGWIGTVASVTAATGQDIGPFAGTLFRWASTAIVFCLYVYLAGVICLVKRSSVPEVDFWNEELHEIRDFDR